MLMAINRVLRGRYDLTLALGPQEALNHLAKKPFEVVMSDMRMPGMEGTELLKQVKVIQPGAMRMILSGQSDLEAAAEAINEGGIFRFLIKPASREALMGAVDAALEHQRLLGVEKELLERTLTGSIDALSETLALANPEAFGRARRLKRIVSELAKEIGLTRRWQLEVAASLSQLGAVSLPNEIAHRFFTGETLSESEKAMLARSASVPRHLLRHIPRLEPVIDLLDALSSDGELESSMSSLEATTLRVAANVERRLSNGESVEKIIDVLDADTTIPRVILESLKRLGEVVKTAETKVVSLANLKPGMVLVDDVRTRSGALLISHGHEVSESLMMRLRNFASTVGVKEPLRVSMARETEAMPRLVG